MANKYILVNSDINITDTIIRKKINKYNKAKYEANQILKRLCNDLLKETDKYLICDYPITEESKKKIKEHRQNIRDLLNSVLFHNVFKTDFLLNSVLLEISHPTEETSLNPI